MNRIAPEQAPEAIDSIKLDECLVEINTHLEPTCRICFEGELPSKQLITPCKCSGSVRHIHEECLKTWILSQNDDISNAQCELCLYRFNMHYKMSMKFDANKMCREGVTQCIFAPLLLLILSMMGLIMYLLILRFTDNISSKEIAYNVILLVICALAISLIFLMMAKAIRNYCCKKKMTEWTIRSCNSDSAKLLEESQVNNFTKFEDTVIDARRDLEIPSNYQSNDLREPRTYRTIDYSLLNGRGVFLDTPIFRRRNRTSFGH